MQGIDADLRIHCVAVIVGIVRVNALCAPYLWVLLCQCHHFVEIIGGNRDGDNPLNPCGVRGL